MSLIWRKFESDAANGPHRLLHALQLLSSGMFSAAYETQTVTCLVEYKHKSYCFALTFISSRLFSAWDRNGWERFEKHTLSCRRRTHAVKSEWSPIYDYTLRTTTRLARHLMQPRCAQS